MRRDVQIEKNVVTISLLLSKALPKVKRDKRNIGQKVPLPSCMILGSDLINLSLSFVIDKMGICTSGGLPATRDLMYSVQ